MSYRFFFAALAAVGMTAGMGATAHAQGAGVKDKVGAVGPSHYPEVHVSLLKQLSIRQGRTNAGLACRPDGR